MLMSSYHLSCQLAQLFQVDMPYLSGMCIVSLKAKLEFEVITIVVQLTVILDDTFNV